MLAPPPPRNLRCHSSRGRDSIQVHPDAELFRLMSSDEPLHTRACDDPWYPGSDESGVDLAHAHKRVGPLCRVLGTILRSPLVPSRFASG
jgi:hypothetical protein